MHDLDMPITWLDLDGVFADFDGGIRKLLGVNPDEADRERMWAAVQSEPGFWRSLDPLEGAARLFEWLSPYDPPILTGVHADPADCEADKAAWVLKHLGPRRVLAVPSSRKPHFARPGDVLVDDRKDNIDAWEAVGGFGVLHETPERTLAALTSLGLEGNGKYSESFLAAVAERRRSVRRNGFTGYEIDAASRARLANTYAPRHDRVHGDHVTRAFPAGLDVSLVARPMMRAVGLFRGEGIEAFAVEVDGELLRPDGRAYHLTWSTQEPARPQDANGLLERVLEAGGPESLRNLPEPVRIGGTFALLETLRMERKRKSPVPRNYPRTVEELFVDGQKVGVRETEDRGRTVATVLYDQNRRPHSECSPAVLVVDKESGKVVHEQWFIHGAPSPVAGAEPPAPKGPRR